MCVCECVCVCVLMNEKCKYDTYWFETDLHTIIRSAMVKVPPGARCANARWKNKRETHEPGTTS
eukprot:COSAG02_NODE_4747_length_5030_cov_83.260799_3_plen_64_part_00